MILLSKRMAAEYIDKRTEESGNITYIYDEKHLKKRNKQKEKKVKRLEGSISDLRKKVLEDLKSDDPKLALCALSVGLIDDTYERVGNTESAEGGHFGVTTWKVKHITFSGGKAKIKYVGKSGVKQDKEVKQKSLVSALKALVKGKKKNDNVFETDDFKLSANDVNRYLKKFKISAKDIRGYHANTEMRKALKSARKGKLPKDEKEKTKKLKEEFKKALEETAKKVGHEPGTLKNQYLIHSIEENYMNGKTASFILSIRAEYKPDPEEEEREKEDSAWWDNMTDEEKQSYEDYWNSVGERVEEEERSRPKRMRSELTLDEIEWLSEMDSEEKERFLSRYFIDDKKKAEISFTLSKRAGQTFTDNKLSYSVDMLIEITANNKIEEIPINSIEWNLEEKVWEKNTSPKDVLDNPSKHEKEANCIEEADLKHPILLYKGEVIDGYHRLAKAIKQNKKSIKARVITEKQMDAVRIDKKRIKELNATDEGFRLSKRAGKVDNILHLFHHIHHEDSEHETHHCGGKHPGSKYKIEHCSCGKHIIDKEEAIGHASDKNIKPMEVKIRFTQKCPDGGWHIESGKLVKSAQDLQPKSPGAQILIEPYDTAVAKALAKLPPNIKNNITKIVVHPEGGSGQLGHVEMGPGKDPREVHIFKARINEQVRKMFGTSQPTPIQLEDATHRALVETLTHEGIHIGPEKTQEQILQPGYRFRDESGTEMETKNKLQGLFPNAMLTASLSLDNIRSKYFPFEPMTEPDLEFTAYCVLDKKYNIVKKGISLIKDPNIHPIVLEIQDAIEFNKQNIGNKKVGRVLGFLNSTCTSEEEVFKLACWQVKNSIHPTGKLDKQTVLKLSEGIVSDNLPRNFGTVVPGKLYRGGIIDNIEQIKNLKDKFGIKRIISLHNHPEIGRMCGELGIEHLPAPIEIGTSEEYGRKILGPNVSKLLSEKPTYIHCWFGSDRTGGVIARFRTENGWTNRDAYLEAKAYGFKDLFADLIDWFSEVGKGPVPVDTKQIRRMIKKLLKDPNCPYKNPEITEQDAQFTPESTPTDEPLRGEIETFPRYERWSDTVKSVNPIMTMTPPAGLTGY